MGITAAVKNLLGGSSDEPASDDSPDEDPSHLCQSCGEEYYSDPEIDIETCRSCGGVKVESIASGPAA